MDTARTYTRDDFTVWNNSELGDIEVIYLDNDFWTIASEFAEKLGLKRSSGAAYNLSAPYKRKIKIKATREDDGKVYKYIITNTDGMNALIDRANIENAPKWKDWIAQQTGRNSPEDAPETAENAIIPTLDNPVLKFTSEAFGEIRVLEIDGEPWFVAVDVCRALDISDTGRAVSRLEPDESTRIEIDHPQSINKKLEVISVNEPGLYSLVLGSRKPEAKDFKRWITHEVIPNIRKTGAYLTPELFGKLMNNPDYLAPFLQNYARLLIENKELTEKNAQLAEVNANLTEANENLSTTNDALVKDTLTWDDNVIINALVHTYAGKFCAGDMTIAWKFFHRAFAKKMGINLPTRRKVREAMSGKKCRGSLLSLMDAEEMREASKIAVAICEDAGLNVPAIINEVNAGHFAEESED